MTTMIRKGRNKIEVEKGSFRGMMKKQEDNKKLLVIGCLGTMLMLMQRGLNASESCQYIIT